MQNYDVISHNILYITTDHTVYEKYANLDKVTLATENSNVQAI